LQKCLHKNAYTLRKELIQDHAPWKCHLMHKFDSWLYIVFVQHIQRVLHSEDMYISDDVCLQVFLFICLHSMVKLSYSCYTNYM